MKLTKKGFTLIELLAVFGIMSLILIIAIISVSGITKAKKEESFNTVKEEVKSAAIDYISSHEYLINDSSRNKTKIPLGKLIDEDYLNAVTNPITGKKISSCSIVEVIKENNKLVAEFKDNLISSTETNCDPTTVRIYKLDGPGFELNHRCYYKDSEKDARGKEVNEDNDWCYESENIVELASPIEDIESLKYCFAENDNDISCNDDNKTTTIKKEDCSDGKCTFIDDDKHDIKKLIVEVTNENNVTNRDYKTYGIDREPPNIDKTSIKVDISDDKLTITGIEVSDDKSGVSSKSINNKEISSDAKSVDFTKDEIDDLLSENRTFIKSVDKVGNESKSDIDVYNECSVQSSREEEGECDCTNKTKTITTIYEDNYMHKECRREEKTASCIPNNCNITCPKIDVTPASPNGNNDFYKSNISVKVTPDNTIDHWAWQTKGSKDDNWTTWSSNDKGTLTKKITAEGTYSARVIAYSSGGNSKTCSVGKFKLDKTSPSCPTIKSNPSKPNGDNGYYTKEVALTITPSNDTDHWEWATDDSSISTGWHTWNTNNKGKQAGNLKADGTRQGRIIVYDKAGNSKTCYTDKYKIDKKAPDCPSIKTSGKKGDHGWYISKIDVKVSKPADVAHWKWYTRYEGEYTYYSNNTSGDTKTLSDGTDRRGRVQVFDKAGNDRNCYTDFFDVDTHAPVMHITSGPGYGSCGGVKAISTKFYVTDNLSGIAVEKDYYGYDSSYDFTFSNRLVSRGYTVGSKRFPSSGSYDHTWGPRCKSVGSPGNHKYKLKYYLEDRAGNNTKGMSSGYNY